MRTLSLEASCDSEDSETASPEGGSVLQAPIRQRNCTVLAFLFTLGVVLFAIGIFGLVSLPRKQTLTGAIEQSDNRMMQGPVTTTQPVLGPLADMEVRSGAANGQFHSPRVGWLYYFEADVPSTCDFKILSTNDDCSSISFWKGAGINQQFVLEDAGSSVFYLKMHCGHYLSYANDCGNQQISTSLNAGSYQKFQFVDGGNFAVRLEATGRVQCPSRFIGFDSSCKRTVQLTSSQRELWFPFPASISDTAMAATSSMAMHEPISPGECADPYVWRAAGQLHLVCTGGELPLYDGTELTKVFSAAGHALPAFNAVPEWLQVRGRWAPETLQVGSDNFIFFSSPHDGCHRLAWARADSSGGGNGKWSKFAGATWFNGFSAKSGGGEIDPNVFQDGGKYYLLWKSDDNNSPLESENKRTRLWMQQLVFKNRQPVLIGKAKVLLTSEGVWWVRSFVAGGSLIEGPEMIKRGAYYYLFYAAGRFCQWDYGEGVARSKSPWGPFEKMRVPFLSSGVVGTTIHNGETVPLVGPGHAGFIRENGELHAVFHASPGPNPKGECHRYAYVAKVKFRHGWPYVNDDLDVVLPDLSRYV